ncbi:putative symporter YjmB [Oxobacter pfennigii]|uniref:Putative symporter YjmB n=1 Tax=Oxobacter pfennigii TaxID=36849 RepID=A0A0P8X0U3_9CLOT|nr:MFS transporter [Oxobacter pfennigii]KPU44402.1 putative symporter YjmB [Oxobacter pfennigii]
MSLETGRIKPWKIYAYGTALFGFGIMMAMNTTYYSFFLTDVAMIPAAIAASILFICRIGDMILVPIVSGLMEKINLRWGKYRSWLLIAPPITAVSFTLMFTNLNVSTSVKIVFLVTAYLIAHAFVNFEFAALYALLPMMGKHPADRTLISARRVQFSSAAQIIFGYIAMPIILFFTGGNAKAPGLQGFFITTAIFSTIMLITFWFVFYISKEFDMPSASIATANKPKGLTVGEMLEQAFKNPPFIALIVGDTCRGISTFAVSGTAAYYFRYVVQDSQYFPYS